MIGRDFLFAGKAIFTVQNPQGEYYTYRVRKLPKKYANARDTFAVGVLNGSDNESNYAYIGLLSQEDGSLIRTAKSNFSDDALAVRVGAWALKIIFANSRPPEGYKIRHSGRCGRCGRTLTEPESLTTGLGPECRAKIGGAIARRFSLVSAP